MVMIEVYGSVMQANGEWKEQTHVHSFGSIADIPILIARYEAANGVCGHMTVKIVK